MVPTFTCGLDRSNFSLAMSQEPRALVMSIPGNCFSSLMSAPALPGARQPHFFFTFLAQPPLSARGKLAFDHSSLSKSGPRLTQAILSLPKDGADDQD